MARTAPVPNIPAIPGMNPGIFVMGGGGSGGGGSGKGGNKGDGKEGANGNNGGNDAGSGGKCAGSAGTGCPVHTANPAAGDPVELSTGRVFSQPSVDVVLGGAFPFEFKRQYSSFSYAVDMGFGFGWSHSLAWSLFEKRISVEVTTEKGEVISFAKPVDVGDASLSVEGFLLLRENDAYVLSTGDGKRRVFRCGSDPSQYRLSEIRDHNDNKIVLEYDQNVLARVRDSAGRVIAFRRNETGRIAAIWVYNAHAQGQWVSFAAYTYDSAGDLISAADGDGNITRYRYEGHLLIENESPSGFVFYYRYRSDKLCAETWGNTPGRADESLADDVPAFLADGITKAKGVHHVVIDYGNEGYVEVMDSLQVQRFVLGSGHGGAEKTVSAGGVTVRTFDAFGYLRKLRDPMGGETTFERDEQGRLLAQTDPLGRTYSCVRNRRGMVTEEILPDGGRYQYGYDERGNRTWMIDPNGGTTTVRYDSRGLVLEKALPGGGATHYAYDTMGNMIEERRPDGSVITVQYDYFGRPIYVKGPLGAAVSASYSLMGDCISMTDADGSVTRYVYDGDRRLIQVILPLGRSIRYQYGGYNRLVREIYPNGDLVRNFYNREGFRVSVHNEIGEKYYGIHNKLGLLREEKFFGGRRLRMERDALGRVTKTVNELGEVTEFEYDAAGQLIKKVLPDDSEVVYCWDLCGRPVGMKSPAGEFRILRDLMGNPLRETQLIDDISYEIEYEFDKNGRRKRCLTNFGHQEEMERDALGLRTKVKASGGAEIQHQRDAGGGEAARLFSGGGRLDLNFDVIGRLTGLCLRSPNIQGADLRGKPEWLGSGAAPDAVMERRFSYDAMGELLGVWDTIRKSSVEYAYDLRMRLQSRVLDGVPREEYEYDGAGNIFVKNGRRRYGAGSKLEENDRVLYEYDLCGRLIEKRVDEGGGRVSRYRYAWTADGMLSNVETPDGAVVSFEYDPIGRRTRKTVVRALAGGQSDKIETRFVWSGDKLVHEIKRRAEAGGDRVIEERTYGWMDEPLVPWGMRIRKPGTDGDDEGQWAFYVMDQAGTPIGLCSAEGELLCEYDRAPLGELVARPGAKVDSPIRFQGQYADEEIGLHYNRFRYYDPEIGRYISPDPLGIRADLNAYKYGDNAIGDVDPLGLAPHRATATLGGKKLTNSVTGSDDFLSGWSGKTYDNYDPYIYDIKDKGATFGTCYRECHSEFKIMRELQKQKDKGVNLKGKTVKIHGDKRSCPNCAAALEEFAQANQMKIIYTSDEDGDNDPLEMDFTSKDKSKHKSNRVKYSQTTVAGY